MVGHLVLLQAPRERRDAIFGGGEVERWVDARDHVEEVEAARRIGGLETQGQPEIVTPARGEPQRHDRATAARDDSDHGVRLIGEHEGSADQVGIAAEAAAPEVLADHHDPLGRGIVLPGRERASAARQDAEHPRQVGRHPRRAQHLRLAAAGESERGGEVGAGLGKDVRVPLPVLVLGEQRRHLVFALKVAHHHQAGGVGIRQRAQERHVDHAEDRGSGADAAGEHQHDGERERGRGAQASQRVPSVLQQLAERVDALGSPQLAAVVDAQPARHRGGIAEAGAGLFTRGGKVEAGRDEVALELIKMEADLVIDVGGDVGSPEAEVAAPAWLIVTAHRPTPPMATGSTSSTISTARAKRVQLDPCTWRCFWPARLIA